MSFLVGRDGNISVLRVGAVFGILGLAIIVGGYLLFQLELRTFQSPLNVRVYPNAQQVGQQQIGDSQTITYMVPGVSPEEVMAYYDELLADHNGENVTSNNRVRCNRYPLEGQFEDYVEGAGIVPYYFLCNFDESGWDGANRSTVINIQPGVRNDALQQDTTGNTMIVYEQYWD
jgi:hypothetical protein